MKKNDFLQIKGLDIKELKLKMRDLKGEITNLVLDKNMKKLKDLKIISKKKRDLAQVLTVLRQKELLAQLESKVSEKEVKVLEAKQEKKTVKGSIEKAESIKKGKAETSK